MNRDEVMTILEKWFHDPIDKSCPFCEAAKEICQQFEPKVDEEYEAYMADRSEPKLDMSKDLLLTPEEKMKAFENYPCLDPSFEDDYSSEVATLLEAQLAKAQVHEQAKVERIVTWVDKNWLDSSNLQRWEDFKKVELEK